MSPMAVLAHGPLLNLHTTNPECHTRSPIKRFSCFNVCSILFVNEKKHMLLSRLFRSRIRSFKQENKENFETSGSKDIPDKHNIISNKVGENAKEGQNHVELSFIAMIAIALGIAVMATLVSIVRNHSTLGSSLGLQILSESTFNSAVASSPAAFSFKTFGYRIILPEYAPGWIYFWLLMAAGCGLFISEEALNIWVCLFHWLANIITIVVYGWNMAVFCRISLEKCFIRCINSPLGLLLQKLADHKGKFHSATVCFRGVCISDLIPFYLGKLFRQSGASDDVSSRIGIGKEKALEITQVVQKYGNLIGFVERFSLGVRNPTAFVAGALGVSPECFFAGVCCGGLFTLPIQLGIGFLLKERPIFALATVATVVGIWTIFPYAMAALTALFFYLRRRYSS